MVAQRMVPARVVVFVLIENTGFDSQIMARPWHDLGTTLARLRINEHCVTKTFKASLKFASVILLS